MSGVATSAPQSVRLLLDANAVVGEKKKPANRFWTNREVDLVRQHYTAGGVPELLPLLPGRTAKSIYQRAGLLRLHGPKGHGGGAKVRLPRTPEIDDAITRWHGDGAHSEALSNLSRATMRPRHWLQIRARELGLTAPRYKPEQWAEVEDAIVRERVGQTPHTISRALRVAGHDRTVSAVASRMKRMGVSRVDPDKMTPSDVVELFGVNRSTVLRWIERDMLAVKRQGKPSGSPHTITRVALRTFALDNVAAYKLGRVDPHWFVDLIGGRAS